MNGRTVLLYGRSLLLSGVAAGLEQFRGLRTMRATTWSEAGRLLADQPPDVLIFDLTSSNESHILPLLLTNPGLLLIGLDTEHNQAVLVSGQNAGPLTLNRIRQILQENSTIRRTAAREEGHEAS